MRINPYDRVSSFMMALVLALIGGVIAALFYWFQTRPAPPPLLVAMEVVDVVGGGDLDGAPDETPMVESPEEVDELQVQEQLDMVTQVSDQASIQAQMFVEPQDEYAEAEGSVDGTGRRPLGFGPGSGGGVARELRWVVQFANDASLTAYAAQLDYFGIELGAMFRDGRLVYLSDVSKSPKSRVVTSGRDEKRLYFTWQGGERKQADIQLFQRAGVDASRANILHFYPENIENVLATLELKYANRPAKDIRRTYFQVLAQRGGYSFEVTRQTYLK
ncbi:MAG: hypothetical protein KF774_14480 [Planctomyces sp.]|nr:hypothetical protein [Planctomyces sp.]